MSNVHTIEGVYFANPSMPTAGAIANMADHVRFEITIIADNPLSSCNYKINRHDEGETSIDSERLRLIELARKGGYSGIAQIADYDKGECLTFRL